MYSREDQDDPNPTVDPLFSRQHLKRNDRPRADVCKYAGMAVWRSGYLLGNGSGITMSALRQSVLVLAGACFAAGAVVGAIHSLFLLRLADRMSRAAPA
jgi:hypothetical protein